jgi:hypothetical protein
MASALSHIVYRTAKLHHVGSLYILTYDARKIKHKIKMDLQEVGGGCGDWMELAQDKGRWRALASTVMNFRVP